MTNPPNNEFDQEEEESNKPIKNPFDALFKNAMENIDVARDVLQTILPAHMLEVVDFNVLDLCPQSFIDAMLSYKHVDLLYRTKIQGQTGYIYLLTEAQKEPDADLPFRMMQYVLRIIEYHQKQSKTKQFPLIYPMIYYLGEKPYNYSTDFFDGFGDNKELAKQILTSPFQVEHVAAENWNNFVNHPLASTLGKIFSLAYSRDIINELQQLKPGFEYIEQHYGSGLILSMLKFTLRKVEGGDAEDILQIVSQMLTEQTRGEVMTLAQQLEQRGMQQGMYQEKHLIAENLLKHGLDLNLISDSTGLELQELKEMKAKLEETKH